MNTVNVVKATNELNEEIASTKLKFPELDCIDVRELIITKLLIKASKLEDTLLEVKVMAARPSKTSEGNRPDIIKLIEIGKNK